MADDIQRITLTTQELRLASDAVEGTPGDTRLEVTRVDRPGSHISIHWGSTSAVIAHGQILRHDE